MKFNGLYTKLKEDCLKFGKPCVTAFTGEAERVLTLTDERYMLVYLLPQNINISDLLFARHTHIKGLNKRHITKTFT